MNAQDLLDLERAERSESLWSLADYESELASGESRRFFWPQESAPQGFVFYRTVDSEAWVVHLAVREKGKRHGSALLEAFLLDARAAGLRTVGLEVKESNLAAVALYLGVGFTAVGRRGRYYRDGSDAIVMRLTL